MVMRNGEPRSVMNHSHHSLTQDNIISTASTCPFLTLAKHRAYAKFQLLVLFFFLMKTKLSLLAFFSLSFPISLSIFLTRPREENHCFWNHGVLFITRAYIYSLWNLVSVAHHQMSLWLSLIKLVTFSLKGFILYHLNISFYWGLPFLFFIFFFFITYGVTLTI